MRTNRPGTAVLPPVALFLAALLAVAAPALADDWTNDLDGSLAKAAKEKKPVVVDIAADG